MGTSELAAVCEMALSGMSRVVGRLESEGLVRRRNSGRWARSRPSCSTFTSLRGG
ncbi:helix-turn-helix domain-containing protein [Micromonospora sp. NPDC048909]|uniref:MarR family transcriptional regulator n=1 Tax=Micromonospora sp. NPDC048909 TaxID=3155643 RepID=UPI003406C612